MNKEIEHLVSLAREQNWTVELTNGGHVKFTNPKGDTHFCGSTPSLGGRKLAVITGDLRRLGLLTTRQEIRALRRQRREDERQKALAEARTPRTITAGASEAAVRERVELMGRPASSSTSPSATAGSSNGSGMSESRRSPLESPPSSSTPPAADGLEDDDSTWHLTCKQCGSPFEIAKIRGSHLRKYCDDCTDEVACPARGCKESLRPSMVVAHMRRKHPRYKRVDGEWVSEHKRRKVKPEPAVVSSRSRRTRTSTGWTSTTPERWRSRIPDPIARPRT